MVVACVWTVDVDGILDSELKSSTSIEMLFGLCRCRDGWWFVFVRWQVFWRRTIDITIWINACKVHPKERQDNQSDKLIGLMASVAYNVLASWFRMQISQWPLRSGWFVCALTWELGRTWLMQVHKKENGATDKSKKCWKTSKTQHNCMENICEKWKTLTGVYLQSGAYSPDHPGPAGHLVRTQSGYRPKSNSKQID